MEPTTLNLSKDPVKGSQNFLLPLSAQPESINLSQGLEWMIRREQLGDACNRGVVSLHPSWTQLVNRDGAVLYMNRSDRKIGNNFIPAPLHATCGGLLCDEMGLGKTLQVREEGSKARALESWIWGSCKTLPLVGHPPW
jgi:SNF2 family DNA or RNA helicase